MKPTKFFLLCGIVISATFANTSSANGRDSCSHLLPTLSEAPSSTYHSSRIQPIEFEHDGAFSSTIVNANQYEHDGAFVTYQPRNLQAMNSAHLHNTVISSDYEHDGAFVTYHTNNTSNRPSLQLTSVALNQTISVADLVRFINGYPEYQNTH